MKQTILIAVLFFFVGSITTYTYFNYFNTTNNILNPLTSSIEGSEWVSENQKAKFKFSENDNSCYLELQLEEENVNLSFTYSKINNEYLLKFKEDGVNFFAAAFLFDITDSMGSIPLKLEDNSLFLPLKDNKILKFNRVK